MLKRFIYLLIHLYYVGSSEVMEINNKKDVETELLKGVAKCLNTIKAEKFIFRPTVAIDTKHMKNKTKCSLFNEVLTNSLMEYNIPLVIITNGTKNNTLNHTLDLSVSSEKENSLFSRASRRNYEYFHTLKISYFDSCDDVVASNFNDADIKYRQLIIISDPFMNECIDKLEKISHAVSDYDVTFLLPDIRAGINRFLTFLPKIDVNSCKHSVSQPTQINTCTNGVLESYNLYPNKNPTNLNKCSVKIGLATLYPFSMIENKDSLETYDRINGSVGCDIKILNIVSDYFNATMDLYYIFRNEENPYRDLDFLNFLRNKSLDICAGGLYRIYGQSVEYSGVYAGQAVVWMYRAERDERSWENLIGKVNGLYIFCIFYIIYSVIWYLIRHFDGDAVTLKNTLVYGWGALVGASSLQDARSFKQKILNLVYLVMSIHFSAYVSVQLYSFLTITAPPPTLNTIDAVMNSGRKPYLKPGVKYFNTDKKYVEFANSSEDCASFVDCAEKTLEYNGLTILLQAIFYHFQALTSVRDEARVLQTPEKVLMVYNEMLIRKDSPLVKKFQKVVKSLFEAGITHRLHDEAVGILNRAKADSANSNLITSSYSCHSGCSITFLQIAGVFYLWLFGCGLSCLVFVVEICFKREQKQVIVTPTIPALLKSSGRKRP